MIKLRTVEKDKTQIRRTILDLIEEQINTLKVYRGDKKQRELQRKP